MFIVLSFGRADPVNVQPQTVKGTPVPAPTFSEARNEVIYISSDSLFRTVDQYLGEYAYYRGQVIQTQSFSNNEYLLRVNVTEGEFGIWTDDIRLDYQGERLREDDVMEFIGQVQGMWQYQAVMGNSREIPHLSALRLCRVQ